MPYVRHLLASVEVAAVTQARASDDYVVGPLWGPPNWNIGGQSLLIEALGLAPSKDGFWSTSVQAGNPYGDAATEPFPRLQAAVCTLSAGPVAIGDGIGFTDAALVLRSCMADGRLLQPSHPASPIDASVLAAAFGAGRGPAGHVWFAPSRTAGRVFGNVLVIDLTRPWTLTPAHLTGLVQARDGLSLSFWIWEANATTEALFFSAQKPLVLPPCGRADFQLWTVAPIERNGWAFQGESATKWAGVSATRWLGLTETTTGLTAEARCVADERVTAGFVRPDGATVHVTCACAAMGVVEAVELAPRRLGFGGVDADAGAALPRRHVEYVKTATGARGDGGRAAGEGLAG